MPYILDSNILLRLVHRSDPNRLTVRSVIRALRHCGEALCHSPQNLVEFWSVSTHPIAARSGYGMTPRETDRRMRLLIERFFTLLPDNHAVHVE